MMRKADELVERVKDIPTLPSVLMQVNRALADDCASMESVVSIIEKDPSLTSKVLRLANSSYYGMSRHVGTLREAIFILGLNTVRSIAMAVSVSALFRDGPNLLDMKALWVHSLSCAVATKALLGRMGTVVAEEGFVCGLLHDIGKVILAQNLPEEMSLVVERLRSSNEDGPWQVEREILGFTHADVGALVARRWNFPKTLCDAIESHHGPEEVLPLKTDPARPAATRVQEGPEGPDPADNPGVLAWAISVGDRLARVLESQPRDPVPDPGEPPPALALFGIPRDAYPALVERVQGDLGNALETWEVE